MNKPAVKETPSTIDLVRAAWDGNDGDMPGASQALFDAVTADQAFLNHILPGVVMTWCREQIGLHIGRIRIAAIQPAADPARGARLRSAIAASLFDFPLPGGKRLGDANAQEIEAGAQAYRQSANDAAHKSRWLDAVAARVGRKNRAETALTLQQLEQLFEEARDGQ